MSVSQRDDRCGAALPPGDSFGFGEFQSLISDRSSHLLLN